VEEVTGEPGGLPLMSHALLETWRRRKGRALGEAAYEAAGGIHGAIARTAEDIYTQLTPTQADTARGILLRLITPGDGTPDTRRPTTRTELGSSQHDRDGDTATVLERLAHARLITLDGGTVDLAHEALIASWPRLRGWIDTDRGRLRIHRQLTEASLVWNDLDRDPGALYRGTRLAAAEEAFPTAYRKSGLSTLEMKFLMASLAARDREQRAVARTTRRLRAFTAALCVLALLASGTAALAFQQRATARTERDTAVSRQMTAEADRLRGTDAALQTQNASLAAQLDIAAYRKHPSPQTHISLISASTATLFSEISDQIGLVHEVTDTANNSAVTYSPDRKMLAIAGIDGTVRLWDIHDFTRPKRVGRSLTGPSGTVVAFSPRGHVLAVAGNWTIKLWNTSRPAHLTPLGVLQLPGNSAAASVAFSSDGRTLASGGERVTLWDVRDIAHPQQMDGSLPGGSVAFSPHGHVLATAYDGGGNVRLWDLSRLTHPAALSVLHTQTAVNFSVLAFSPDGRYLATDGTGIGQIRLWDTKNPVRPKVLDVPISNSDRTDVSAVAFSSNGHIVAVAGDNGTQLWNVTDPGDPLLLGKSLGHPSAAGISLVFGPDGRSLITIGTALRIWNLPPTVLTDCPNDSPVAFSPDGRTMATVCDTNERIWLWDTTDPTNPRHLGRALPGHIAAFAPHGHFLAIAADDGSVAFWDTADPTRPRHFGRRLTTPGDDGLDALAFSPDGHTLATTEVGEGNRIWLWDTTDPARARRLGQNLAPPVNYFLVGPVAFSPDGHTLAIPGHGDGNHNRIWLWDTTDPAHPQRLGRTIQGGIPAFAPLGHTLAVGTDIGDRAIQLWDTTHPAHLVPLSTPLTGTDPGTTPAFSPDGRTLAIGGDDGSVRLWNTKDPVHPVALGDPVTGHTSGIATMTFRPRDHILATVSIDGTIRLWDLDAERVIRRICTVTGHVLTRQRWQQYVGTIPYQSPCP
jgi:WD40 repeat protein